MRLTIEPTERIVAIGGTAPIRARIWRALSEFGEVLVLVAALVVPSESLIDAELQADQVPVGTRVWASDPPKIESRPGSSGVPAIALFPAAHPACASAERCVQAVQPMLDRLAQQAGAKPVLDAVATLYMHWLVRHYGAELALQHLERMREVLPRFAAGHAGEPQA